MAVGTTAFPTALDTAVELVELTNNASSTLTSGISAGDTTITVDDPAEFPTTGFGTLVDDLDAPTTIEIISWTGKSGSNLTGVTRGAQGTSAAAFSAGEFIEVRPTKGHHEALRGAIIAIETKLGYGSSTSTANTVLLGNGTGTSAWGAITNAYIDASAAIALSKLATVTASRALVSDASGFVSASSVTATELGYLTGVTSAIQTQLDGKSLTSHNHDGTYQPVDTDLTAIAALSPSDDDIIQRKASAWTNRTMAQLKADLSLSASDVGLGSVENTALSTWAGSTNITTLGTIATGTWNGSVIGSSYGGAGTVSGILKANGSGTVSAAVSGTDYVVPSVTSLSSLTTVGTITTGGLGTGAVIGGVTMTLGSDGTGDIYYRSAGGVLTRLAAGTDGHVLTLASGLPSWAAASGGGLTVGTTAIASGTAGRILYEASGNVLGEAAGITYQTGASPTVTITAQAASYVGLRVNSAATPSANIFETTVNAGADTGFIVNSAGNPTAYLVATTTSTAYGAHSVATGHSSYANATVIGQVTTTGTGAFDGNVLVGNMSLTTTGSTNKNTFIGYLLSAWSPGASTIESVSVGYNALARESNSVVIGAGANNGNTGGVGSVAIGSSADIDADSAIAIGSGATVASGDTASIAIGRSAATVNANELVIGSSSYPIDNAYMGKGVTNATPTAYTLNGTGGSGTNIAGADLQLAGGKGTGTGAAGKVSIQTAPAGSSGSSLNTLVTALQVDADTTAGNTRLLIHDVDNATLERVSVGAADSGGTGFKVLRIPN